MTIVQLLAKKRISRQLFKVCRLGGFETLTQIKLYFWEHGTFEGLKWTNPEEISELEALINADLLRLGRQWKLSEDLLKSQSLVQIAAVLLEKELLPKKQMDLFMASSRIYQSTRPRTVFELAPEMGMQERSVRGLRTRTIRILTEKLRSLQVLREDIQLNYGLDLSSDLLIFDESLARNINQKAKTCFTPEFLGWLFGISLEKEFATLGRPEEVLAGNYLGHRHYWKGFYLLRKEIAAALDLDALLSETYRLLNNGARESRSLDFKTFVSHFVKDVRACELEVLLPVTAEILYRELDLRVGGTSKLVIPEQGELLLRCYCREALEALGEPATRERIRRKISEQHPEVFVDLAGFGSVMLFEYGFTSYRHVYGLKEWFSRGGGSLKRQDPQLLQDLQKKFPVRWGQYWESHWQENWQALMDFANTHSRLPKKRATGEEGLLKKFWEIQVSRCGRGILNPEYQVLINELRRRFPHNNKIHWKVDWDERFARIKSFAEAHGVPPKSEGPGEEKTMNGWLQAQRSRMKKGNLDRRQVALLTWFDERYHQRTKQHFQRHWEKRYQELEDFARTHSRLPREVIREEKSLNRWFAAQRLRMSKGTLERRQYFLIRDIISQYPLMGLDYLKGCWHEKCGKLEQFVEAHSRLPKCNKEEIQLYQWLQNSSYRGKGGN